MTPQVQQIIEKLSHIQLDLDFIKSHISDIDLVLTDDDMDALQEAEEDLKNGKTTRLM
ncbi:MAG: hypothetical protein AABX37_02870 [Nanoarchaeota archaeon]